MTIGPGLQSWILHHNAWILQATSFGTCLPIVDRPGDDALSPSLTRFTIIFHGLWLQARLNKWPVRMYFPISRLPCGGFRPPQADCTRPCLKAAIARRETTM